jgi:hypothetical protein
VGTVSKWGQTDKHGMPFGFVAVGDASHYLATNDLAGSAPAVGDEMVFRVANNRSRLGTTEAKNAAVLISRGGPSLRASAPSSSAFSPPPSPYHPRQPRTIASVARWMVDKTGTHCGFTDTGVYLHVSSVIYGTPVVGCRVSFRTEASRVASDRRQAFDIVVLGDRETTGTIIKWDMKDKKGIPYGFIVPEGSADTLKGAYLSSHDVTGAASVAVGSECVYTPVESLIVANTTVAKGAHLLSSR